MEKLLHSRLSGLFIGSWSPLSITSRYMPEQRLDEAGQKRRADIYDWRLMGNLFTLSVRKVHVYPSFMGPGIERNEYLLDGEPVPPFTVNEVEDLLRETGWMCHSTDSWEENSQKKIARSEKGRELWRRNLPWSRAYAAEMRLDYESADEGSYVLSLVIGSDIPVEADRPVEIEIGFRDWRKGSEPSSDFRKNLADALMGWSDLLSGLGLERPDLSDYYDLLNEIVKRGETEDFRYAVRKERMQGNDGGKLTPMDFRWYGNAFMDTYEQRGAFFDWYEKEAGRGDAVKEEYLRLFGLPEGFSMEELRAAYRKKVRAFHPDTIGSKGLDPLFLSFAERETEKLREAYEYLLASVKLP